MKNNMTSISLLHVNLDIEAEKTPLLVGRLAIQNSRIYFEYDASFIKRELNISPFKLPLRSGLQSFDPFLFEGLAGVFNDSLPDGWGRLLLDRSLRSKGIDPNSFSVLDRLAHVGTKGMGALSYHPDQSIKITDDEINLDVIAHQAAEILSGHSEDVIDTLLEMNGSSAGARPKALIGVTSDKKNLIHGVVSLPANYEHWLVKFSNTLDRSDSGAIEYIYNQMAMLSDIEITESYLFPSHQHIGYFATKRFDRILNKRMHVHTACGLLHADFRSPSLDYLDLIKATLILTKDTREALKMFRLAVFNVLAHNRDDHSKNFSFIMNEKGAWKMAPAYDLTFSFGPRGEQSTMVMGEGKNPTINHLLALAQAVDIQQGIAKKTIDSVQSALAQFKNLATKIGISKNNINEIQKKLLLK